MFAPYIAMTAKPVVQMSGILANYFEFNECTMDRSGESYFLDEIFHIHKFRKLFFQSLLRYRIIHTVETVGSKLTSQALKAAEAQSHIIFEGTASATIIV